MRKFVFAFIMLFVAFSVNAQIDFTVKFLGIPVDGDKSEMILKLKNKGFKYNDTYDKLEGVFNGESVNVYVHTNNDVVDRIIVHQAKVSSETDIKIKFNTLVRQFENNEKYIPEYDNQIIDDNTDISYEMSVNSKRFQASFHQKHTMKETEELKRVIYDNYDSFINKLSENDTIKAVITESEDDNKDDNVNIIAAFLELGYMLNNDVWFMITKLSYDEYYISIFYDNLKNRPNGEDL